ncbi:translation initiation factor IF-2-like, partial [Cygnus atratus]|uniref:translation initiation factor IF-2-like n=1 Tax=Cygnus atratus TaxID=8868 RepID=UPI0021B7761F
MRTGPPRTTAPQGAPGLQPPAAGERALGRCRLGSPCSGHPVRGTAPVTRDRSRHVRGGRGRGLEGGGAKHPEAAPVAERPGQVPTRARCGGRGGAEPRPPSGRGGAHGQRGRAARPRFGSRGRAGDCPPACPAAPRAAADRGRPAPGRRGRLPVAIGPAGGAGVDTEGAASCLRPLGELRTRSMMESRIKRLATTLMDATTDKDPLVQEQIYNALCYLGESEPEEILHSCDEYLRQHDKLAYPHRVIILKAMETVVKNNIASLDKSTAKVVIFLASNEMTKSK